MKISELENAPVWLKEAKTVDEDVSIENNIVIWRGGVWLDGVWYGGVWRSGMWLDGEWRGGEWYGGVWYGGVWRGGEWRGGVWRDGVWRDGMWYGGEWLDGVWLDGERRGGVWRDGEWYGGEWRGGEWLDGEWYGSNTRQMVVLGDDLRGYRFVAEFVSELRIKAGCRNFSFEKARAHWQSAPESKNKVLILHMLEHARRLESALEWKPINGKKT